MTKNRLLAASASDTKEQGAKNTRGSRARSGIISIVPNTTQQTRQWWLCSEKLHDINLLSFSADDAGNAEAMYALFQDTLMFCPALGWMSYTGTHWQPVSEGEASKIAVAALKMRQHEAVEAQNETILKAASPSKRHVSDCLWLYKAFATIEDVNEFDSDPDLLNCQNGVINLKTGSLTPHYPCQRFTYVLPAEYKPDADMAMISTFTHEAVGEEVAHFLQKAVGYTFTGHTREEKLFYLFGPPRAGKGTFTEVLLTLLPHPFGAGVDFNSFTAKREADTQNFDLAPLRPARFVIASESNRYQSLNPAKIKSLTGGDNIMCAFKHRDHFSYRPQFKVWLVSNHPVNADADDDALWARVIVVNFPHSHVGKEDMTLKARLKSTESLEGLLRWIVEGAKRWYAEGLGTLPESVRAATIGHRDMQDYVKQWITERCELGGGHWASSADLIKSYKAWCEEVNVKPISPNQLSGTLTHRFKCTPQRTKYARGFAGIRCLTSQPTLLDGDTGDTGDSKNGQNSKVENLHEEKSEIAVTGVTVSPDQNASTESQVGADEQKKRAGQARYFLNWIPENGGQIGLVEGTLTLEMPPGKWTTAQLQSLHNDMHRLAPEICQIRGWAVPTGQAGTPNVNSPPDTEGF